MKTSLVALLAGRKSKGRKATALAKKSSSAITKRKQQKSSRQKTITIKGAKKEGITVSWGKTPSEPPPGTAPEVFDMSVMHGPVRGPVEATNSGSSFPYQQLEKSKLEIRLITIRPGTDDAPIECILEHVATNRGSRPVYKALSYTWGSPANTKTISLNGMSVQVRDNLWQAMHHLRSGVTDLRLWIDAICINQNDVLERNQQVSRMSAIYGLAVEVLIWLGCQDDGSEVALSFVDHYFGGRSSKLSPGYTFEAEFESKLNAIECLMNRDYWQRVWIIQEIFRARKITIHCGHQGLPWTSFSRFFRHVRKYLENSNERFRVRLERLCSSLGVRLTDHRTSPALNLEELLTTYKSSLSSDPRDKIYSLIGLARNTLIQDSREIEKSEWIAVDYSRTTFNLFHLLALMYSVATDENTRRPQGIDVLDPKQHYEVRWMNLIQEVLGMKGPSTNTSDWDLQLSLRDRSIFWRYFHSSAIHTLGIGLMLNYAWEDTPGVTIGPYWSGKPNDMQSLLDWHDSLPCSTARTKLVLKQILQTFKASDFARLQHFEVRREFRGVVASGSNPEFTLNAGAIRVLMTNDGRQFLFASCEINPGDRIIYFHKSDVAILYRRPLFYKGWSNVADDFIKGRVLSFWSNWSQATNEQIPRAYAVFHEWWDDAEEDIVGLDKYKYHWTGAEPEVLGCQLSMRLWQAVTW